MKYGISFLIIVFATILHLSLCTDFFCILIPIYTQSRVSKTNVLFVFAYFFVMCAIGKFAATDYGNRELKKPNEEARLIKIATRDLVTLLEETSLADPSRVDL